MRKILFALLFFLCLIFGGCKDISKTELSVHFVCSGKFYNYESAYNLSKIVKLRGGSGYIFEKKAYYVFVSMHTAGDIAKSVLSNMPVDYFLYTLSMPILFENLNYFLTLDLYSQDIDFTEYLKNLKAELETLKNSLQDSSYLFLKADFFVICTLINKVFINKLDAEQNAKYLQTKLFFCLYNYNSTQNTEKNN